MTRLKRDFLPGGNTPSLAASQELVKEYSVYPREAGATGVDMLLYPGGDLAVSNTGDLVLASGAELVQEAIARRMATPPFGYQRYIAYKDEYLLQDSFYGNPLYNYLSNYLPEQDDDLIREIEDAARQEPRISSVKVTSYEFVNYKSELSVSLTYTLKSNQEMYNLTVSFNPEFIPEPN